MKKFLTWALILFILPFSVIGCGVMQETTSKEGDLSNLHMEIERLEQNNAVLQRMLDERKKIIQELESEIERLSSDAKNPLLQEALEVLEMISTRDATGLNSKVSPLRGVRFTPYPYVDIDNDVVFHPGNKILSMFSDSTEYMWGSYDGTGEDIVGDFSFYYQRFIYDADYLNAELIGVNTLIGQGNTFNNLKSVYEDDQFVEFHFTGFDDTYLGMDWRSLILVFDDDHKKWHLVGVVHGEWTI